LEKIVDSESQILSLNGLKLNIYVFIMAVPLCLLVSAPYIYFFGASQYAAGIIEVLNYKVFILLFLGIAIHEFLHAVTWMFLQKEGFNNIKFGFNWQALTPYTHYLKPMETWKYRLGGIMPALVMGVLPLAISYIIKNAIVNFVGFLFLWAAAGDMISLWLIRKLKPTQLVQDHPHELGVIVITTDSENDESL